MKKVILIFVTICPFRSALCKDNKSTDALLREIDGIIKNRQTYGAEKEARIADLKNCWRRLLPMNNDMVFADVFSMNTGLIIWIRLLSMLNGKRNWRIAWINWITWMMLP